MKVIDLLNKIANGEEVPQRFIVKSRAGSVEFRYEGEYQLYDNLQEEYIYINDEVEIIEEKEMCHKCGKYPVEYNQTYCEFCLGISGEDKKIEKLDHEDFKDSFGGEKITDHIFVNKINEIIDKVNKGE